MAESKQPIDADVNLMMKEWAQGQSYNSGMYFGQMEQVWDDTISKFPKYLPDDFATGWYYGFTDERLDFSSDFLSTCVEKSDDLTNALNDAYHLYAEQGDWKTGAIKMKEYKTKPLPLI